MFQSEGEYQCQMIPEGSETMKAEMRPLRLETKRPSVEWREQKPTHRCEFHLQYDTQL